MVASAASHVRGGMHESHSRTAEGSLARTESGVVVASTASHVRGWHAPISQQNSRGKGACIFVPYVRRDNLSIHLSMYVHLCICDICSLYEYT